MRMYMCYQKPSVSNVEYYKMFKAIRAVIDVHEGRAGFHEGMFKEKLRDTKTKNGLSVTDPATDEIGRRQCSSHAMSTWGVFLLETQMMSGTNN